MYNRFKEYIRTFAYSLLVIMLGAFTIIKLLDRGIPATIPGVSSPTIDTRDEPKESPRPEAPHAVLLHNDNINAFDFVVYVLMRVFKYGVIKSYKCMWEAHFTGQSIVWSGSKEEAEKHALAVRAFGPDPKKRIFGAEPLRVTVEQLPGNDG